MNIALQSDEVVVAAAIAWKEARVEHSASSARSRARGEPDNEAELDAIMAKILAAEDILEDTVPCTDAGLVAILGYAAANKVITFYETNAIARNILASFGFAAAA